jgi:tetratricopeptide (TPR) repeat protein
MKWLKYFCISALILGLMIQSALGTRKGPIKDAKALITQTKIEMRANPPRYDEAMDLLDTVLATSGPIPEAYFIRSTILGEFANKAYDLNKKIEFLAKMSANHDSLVLSCDSKDVKKKYKKECDKFIPITDSIATFYWKDSYNSGVRFVSKMDSELLPNIKNATDDSTKAEAKAALKAAVDSSILHFRAAIATDPTDYRAYEGAGIAFDRQKMYDSSAAWFIKAMEIVPDSIGIIQNIAYAYIQKPDWDNSIKYFKKLLEIAPDDFSTLMNVAICYNNLQMFDSALAYNKRAVIVDPENAIVNFDLGQYYLHESQVNSEEIRTAQSNGENEKAKQLMKTRDAMLDSSATYFAKGLQTDPENTIALEQYSVIMLIIGQFDKAEVGFKKLSELEPSIKDHWINLGDTYIRLAKFDDAIMAFEKGVEIDPGDSEIWKILGDLYESAGSPQKAKKAHDKAAELDKL